MEEFLSDVKKGVAYSHQRSQEAKRAVIVQLEQAISYFSGEITEAESKALCAKLSQAVKEAIDPLEVHKDSLQYTFPNALSAAVEKYFAGVKQNPKNQAEYDKQKAKRDALVAKGKTVTWKLVPPVLVDLALAKADIVSVLSRLKEKYTAEQEAESSYDLSAKAIEIIDYLKEQASAYVYRVTKAIAKARALKLLEEVGIPEPRIRYNQYPFEFSGGMRQRIVIAIALAANPDILICDEPTTALDVTIQAQILELINRLKKERNLTVIFITHDLGVVANMADRIAVMYAGKIVEYGTSDDVFYDPRHPYTWALLSSMPDLDTKEKLEAIPGTPPNMIYPPIGDAFAERNKYAMEIDFELQPPMFKVSDTHYAATWLLHPDAPKVEMPRTVSERIARRRAKEEKDV
ncbi:MAG: ABC transporter ATP-binding protein [Clostridia bacterium]|nr:ABC transporter ATP-binding protein [Clostridia bacterium]